MFCLENEIGDFLVSEKKEKKQNFLQINCCQIVNLVSYKLICFGDDGMSVWQDVILKCVFNLLFYSN